MSFSTECWYFSQIPGMPRPSRPPIAEVHFARTKYGPELLIDTAWVHDMPTFIRESRPHRLSFYDILLVTRGRGALWLDDRRLAVSPGVVLFTTPGEVRRWRVRGLDGLCLFFTGSFIEEFFRDPLFLYRLRFFHQPAGPHRLLLPRGAATDLRRRLESMAGEIRRLGPDTEHLLRARLYEVLMMLNRRLDARPGGSVPGADHPTVFRFRQLIEERFARERSCAGYARALSVSPGHLNALAHRFLGRSAKAVILDRVLVEARRLLRYTDQPAKQVAWALGFADPAYFARYFRRQTGRSPLEYRAEGRSR